MDWSKLIESGLGSLGGSLINGSIGLVGNKIAHDQAMKDLNYQWNKMYSPQAQVRNMAAAGLNPAAAFGNQAPVISGSQMNLPQNPLGGIGTSSLSDLANYVNAKANATKSGAETRKTDLEADAISFENELNKIFKRSERVANLMSAYKAMQLQDDEHNINEWRKSKEQALSELTGVQRDTATKIFNNMDTQIEQENRQREENISLTKEKQKTEGTQQQANRASAKASIAQADFTESQKKYQDIVNDIKESGKTFELENLLRKWHAENKISDASAEQAYTMLERYRQLNKNDENAAAKYLNYTFWFIKEQMPNLPIVPFLNVGK